MFTNLISRIHNCSRTEDILQASVESVKEALNCDRAVVYSLQPESLGEIVAESVALGFPKTQATRIDDPCFQARHIDSYRQGRVSAIDNIYEARITDCHIETLSKLAVKANLVVPLLLPDRALYGLLIAHQCDAPRIWKPEEITLAVQMAGQIGWAVDNALRWSECQKIQSSLDRQKYYNELLVSATQKIHQCRTRTDVLATATAQAQAILKGDRAIVYSISDQSSGRVYAESTLPALAPLLGSVFADPCLAVYNSSEAGHHRSVHAIDNIHEAGIGAEFVDNLVKNAVKAMMVVPIIGDRNELFGLLSVHQCFGYREWQEMEVEWLRQIGIQTGLALTKAQLQEDIAEMRSSLKRAGAVKNSINHADTQVQQVKESVSNSIQTLDEAKHLMRLLSKEVVTLTDKLSSEDINLVRIITKKLQANAEVATSGTISLQSEVKELETVVNSAIKLYRSRAIN
ncbi:GAF domain-containing protein [Chamaesiphon sp. VAR_48_metabat_403]|uniref:GAF domain-containing protein n=1 Tax=Chamaesiphon sp. VAR_48_metabat_403 TaxID=2964700 RepID=UPI00286DB602|nr:GAF domain-containing protein [Chamaesiphon sp. VAR_48_metabat_403]